MAERNHSRSSRSIETLVLHQTTNLQLQVVSKDSNSLKKYEVKELYYQTVIIKFQTDYTDKNVKINLNFDSLNVTQT